MIELEVALFDALFRFFFVFFFNDTATTEIYTLSLHDALPIAGLDRVPHLTNETVFDLTTRPRSEEHTSELQSRRDLVCRLLLDKKKTRTKAPAPRHALTLRIAGPRPAHHP